MGSERRHSRTTGPFTAGLQFRRPGSNIFVRRFFRAKVRPHFSFGIHRVVDRYNTFGRTSIGTATFGNNFTAFGSFHVHNSRNRFQSLVTMVVGGGPNPGRHHSSEGCPRKEPILRFLSFNFPVVEFRAIEAPRTLVRISSPAAGTNRAS